MKCLITYSVFAAFAFASQVASAQVANEGMANQIIAARQKNAALMKQYNWQCRTEVIVDGDGHKKVTSTFYQPFLIFRGLPRGRSVYVIPSF